MNQTDKKQTSFFRRLKKFLNSYDLSLWEVIVIVSRAVAHFARNILLLKSNPLRHPHRQILALARDLAVRGSFERFDWHGYLLDHKTHLNKVMQAVDLESLQHQPKFSILMPVYNVDATLLGAAIDSVLAQSYSNWELCIADDASSKIDTLETLKKYQTQDSRIKVTFRSSNGHISRATNDALQSANGEWCALMDNDDLLHPDALKAIALAINKNPSANLIYTDEDKIDAEGSKHFAPYFKPDFNYDLLLAQNYINHLSCYRTDILKRIGGFRAGFEGSQDYDMVLRYIEQSRSNGLYEGIVHVPGIYYHWRAIPGSVALSSDQKHYAHTNARRAIQEHLDRTTPGARVEAGFSQLHRVVFPMPPSLPTVSLIIPTKDKPELIIPFLEDLLHRTNYYSNLEIILVDNGSTDSQVLDYYEKIKLWDFVRILKKPIPFNFSALCNAGAAMAMGEYLCFLNNDMRVINPDWLVELVRHGTRPHVGAVGAKLLYANNRIQHAGIVTGVCGGVAGHPFLNLPNKTDFNFGFTQICREVQAVTGACLFLSRSLFNSINCFDETNLPIAYNDVDLCLKIINLGKKIIWSPSAELYHLESVSRGQDATIERAARLKRETEFMLRKWGPTLNDRYYNSYFDQNILYSCVIMTPHKALKMRSPREYGRQQQVS